MALSSAAIIGALPLLFITSPVIAPTPGDAIGNRTTNAPRFSSRLDALHTWKTGIGRFAINANLSETWTSADGH